MANRTEQEVMKGWKYADPPLVSVVCITYNHEPYIRDAIEGFLMQETDFPFEIIIHDDASTDGTTGIIREYEANFPNLIKPIYQTENQYSKGEKVSAIAWSLAKGDYIAFCEGDDFWLNAEKLIRQVSSLRKYPECHICFHSALQISYLNNRLNVICRHSQNTKIFPLEEIIKGGGPFCPTSSLLIKRSVLSSIPNWYYSIAPVGDYFLQIFSSVNGGALFLPETMSAYRYLAPTAWSSVRNNQTFENYMSSFFLRYLVSLECLDYDLNYMFSDILNIERAKLSCDGAAKAFASKHYGLFNKLIIQSWNLKPFLRIDQVVFFYFRHTPILISFLRLTRLFNRRVTTFFSFFNYFK